MAERGDPLAYLAASEHRVALLRAIRDGEGVTRADLVDHVSASRRTVKRSLDGFRERGWIVEGDAIKLSVSGYFILDAYEAFAQRVDLVEELRPFLSRIAEEDCYAGPEEFAGATVVEMDAAYPFTIIEYVLDRYREASERADVLLTYVSVDILDQMARVAGNRGVDLTVVFDVHVRDAIDRKQTYDRGFDHLDDVANLYAVDEPFPFACAVIDDTAVLTLTNDEGLPTVVLRSTNPDFVSIIEDRFENVLSRADPIALDVDNGGIDPEGLTSE